MGGEVRSEKEEKTLQQILDWLNTITVIGGEIATIQSYPAKIGITNPFLDHSIADLITRVKGLNAIYDLTDALNDVTAAQVWAYVTRTLTAHAFPFTNPGAPLDVSNIRTAAYTRLGAPAGVSVSADIAAVEAKLDIPANFMADITTLALEATLNTHDVDIKALINALVDLADVDIWTYVTRNLTNPASETDLQNMRVTSVSKCVDETGSFNWDTSAYTTVEQDISALFTTALTGTTRRKYTVYLDLTGPEGDAAAWTKCTVKVKVKIDGANYRTIDKKDIAKTDVAAAEEPGVPIDIEPVAQDVQITMQFDVALAVDKDIYYHYVKEVLE